MRALIVVAHPEPRSMNGAMRRTAEEALTAAGHEVLVSDLYASGFKAVADAADFAVRHDPDFFKYQVEQARAWEAGTLAADVREEQRRLLWADLVLFQFPLWWFSVPAILKGWFDRVLAPGFAYGNGRFFDTGGMRGRRAMLAVTTGGLPHMYGEDGRYGPIERQLHHVTYGTLAFVGFDVLPTFAVHGPARIGEEARRAELDRYRILLSGIDRIEPMPCPPNAAFERVTQ